MVKNITAVHINSIKDLPHEKGIYSCCGIQLMIWVDKNMHIMLVTAFMPVNQPCGRIWLLNATGNADATGQSKATQLSLHSSEYQKTRLSAYQSWPSQSAEMTFSG